MGGSMVDYRHLSEESRASFQAPPLHCNEPSIEINEISSNRSESFSLKGTSAAASQDDETREAKRRRRWALTLYSATTILLYADQNLMSPNLSAIAEEFQFSDIERDKKLGGDIALGFWMLGVPASFVVGCLADHMNRSVLFAWTVGLGEGACLLTYFSRTYVQLYICRAVTGFSLGGALPLIYSVLGDFFSAEERHGVTALVSMGMGLGISLGQGIAGFLGPTYGWRLPFLVVSVPALVLAAAVLMTVKDPKRGGMERAVLYRQNKEWTSVPQQEERTELELTSISRRVGVADGTSSAELPTVEILDTKQQNDDLRVLRQGTPSSEDLDGCHGLDEGCVQVCEATATGREYRCNDQTTGSVQLSGLLKVFCSLLSRRTVLLALVQGAPGCIPWGIVNTYLNDYLSDNRGMTVEYATFILLLFGFGNFIGLLVGGGAGSILYKIDPRYPAILSGSSAILGCAPFFYLINYINSTSSIVSVVTTALLAGIGTAVTGPIVKATLQNVTLPTTRGQAFALANTFDDFGRGLGPVFVAMLIAGFGGRTPAFNVGLLGWVVCGVLNLAMFLTVTKDEQNVQNILAEMLASSDELKCQNHGDSFIAID